MTDAKDAVLEYLRHIDTGLDPDFLREAIKVMSALLMEVEVQQESFSRSVLSAPLPLPVRLAQHHRPAYNRHASPRDSQRDRRALSYR